jgi:membrane protein implicated in regulation of membrane protease activity
MYPPEPGEHFEEHHAVAHFNTGGHPLGWEIILGGVLFFTGLGLVYIWVATFLWWWAMGIFLVPLGGILLFHDQPLLRPRRTSPHPKAQSPHP